MAANEKEKAGLCSEGSKQDIENSKVKGNHKQPQDKGPFSKHLCNGLQHLANHKILRACIILNLILILCIIVLVLVLPRSTQEGSTCSCIPVEFCPYGWVGYQRKCYYFAKAERNWTSSKMKCSSFNATLAVIDSKDEMEFLSRYKTSADHWIGLQRDLEAHPWKWVNGTIFNNWFPVHGGGECAYLNHNGAASSFCGRKEAWICTKPVNQGFQTYCKENQICSVRKNEEVLHQKDLVLQVDGEATAPLVAPSVAGIRANLAL